VKWDEEVTQDFLKYLLLKLLPCLKQLHNEQREELKVEQNLQRAFSLISFLMPLCLFQKKICFLSHYVEVCPKLSVQDQQRSRWEKQ
jgi:hypothetical protein